MPRKRVHDFDTSWHHRHRRSHQVPSWLTPGAAVQVRNGGTPGADLPGAIVEVKGQDGEGISIVTKMHEIDVLDGFYPKGIFDHSTPERIQALNMASKESCT